MRNDDTWAKKWLACKALAGTKCVIHYEMATSLWRPGTGMWWLGNDWSPEAQASGHLVPSWWCCLERVKNWSLAGGSMPLEEEALRVHNFTLLPVHSLCLMFVGELLSLSFMLLLPHPSPLDTPPTPSHAFPPWWAHPSGDISPN